MAGASAIRFGVSRNHGGLQLLDGARALAEALGGALGETVRLTIAFDYVHLLRNFSSGAIDVAWMPPLLHAQAAREGGTLAAVCQRHGKLTYRSALIVRSSSSYRTITDLAGARVAWVDRGSASGYVFPRLHLAKRGVELVRETFEGSPVAACAAVAKGEADVCACFAPDTSDAEAQLADFRATVGQSASALRILDVTEPIPPDGIALGGHVAAREQTRLRVALLALHQTSVGAHALKTLLQAERLVAPTDEVLRALKTLGASSPPV